MKVWAVFLFAASTLAACNSRIDKNPESPSTAGNMSFAQMQSSILGPKCSRCHTWMGDYEGVQAHVDQISQRIQSADPTFQMPPPGNTPLTAEEKTALLAWIAAGAPEGGGQPPPPPPPPPGLNFANVSAQVFQPRCIQCHDTDFDTYADTRPLLSEISFRTHAIGTSDQMPPAKKTQLTPDELKLLDDWIAAGAPET